MQFNPNYLFCSFNLFHMGHSFFFSLLLLLHMTVGKFSISFPETWGKLYFLAQAVTHKFSLKCTSGC